MRRRWRGLLVGWVLLGCLTGCGGEKNRVSVDGSTSMFRVIGALGEAFTAEHPDVSFAYNPTGSSGGIQAVREGRCDIGVSSRPLKEDERAAGLTGTVLAYDSIALIVHPDNPVNALTLESLAALYTGEITNWSGVGGEDGAVVILGREAGSGTRSAFESATGTQDMCRYRQELSSAGDVIATVAGNPNAIGYASLAAVKDGVKVLAVDGAFPGGGRTENDDYPLRRQFWLVTKTAAQSSGTEAFLDYAASPSAAKILADRGVSPASWFGGEYNAEEMEE